MIDGPCQSLSAHAPNMASSLITVSLVSLSGMMTGQILTGADPVTAVEDQIMVMRMVVSATVIGSLIVVYVIRIHQMII